MVCQECAGNDGDCPDCDRPLSKDPDPYEPRTDIKYVPAIRRESTTTERVGMSDGTTTTGGFP
jgi:hypothetical protein